jgi:hypothetical protein
MLFYFCRVDFDVSIEILCLKLVHLFGILVPLFLGFFLVLYIYLRSLLFIVLFFELILDVYEGERIRYEISLDIEIKLRVSGEAWSVVDFQ